MDAIRISNSGNKKVTIQDQERYSSISICSVEKRFSGTIDNVKTKMVKGRIKGFWCFSSNDSLNSQVMKYNPELKYRNALEAHMTIKADSMRVKNLPRLISLAIWYIGRKSSVVVGYSYIRL